ncbi:MAG: hypothetical protein MJ210_02850 [Alphaproteobacteria bacterium]|nr:hypothetical protein [Alphaproteobacteria bacterium]
MNKIAHYEVYADNGSGWQLLQRFVLEQRHEAYQQAKENEAQQSKVKIIKEVFDASDNTYTETVEYVSNLYKKKATKKSLSNIDYQKSSSEIVQDIADSRRNIYKAIIKFIALIMVSLIFANIIVGMIFPFLDEATDGEGNQSLLFCIFFIVFLAMAVPLVLKNIPWYIFVNQEEDEKQEINEEKFFEKAQNLVRAFNINSDLNQMKTSAYPEAPIEYKQYLIYFLSEILSNLNVRSALQNQFSRLGIKFLLFGACLEIGRYGGLKISEANSILYDAFKITDGDQADLEKFYETKKTYSDNKISIYLTGVGAFLMHQIITDQKLYVRVLNQAFERWEAQRNPEITEQKEEPEITKENDNVQSRVSIKSDLKFLDAAMPNQDEVAITTSKAIREVIAKLVEKHNGTNVIEKEGITEIDFDKVRTAAKFAGEFLKDMGTYIEENNDERMILRNCCALTKAEPEQDVNLSLYISDVFEHVYNNEIIVVKELALLLESEGYELDFLGEKHLKETNQNAELYKLKY